MGIRDFLSKLNIKESVKKITEKLGANTNVLDGDINSYLEMVYGLFFSRGLKDGDKEWSISKERVVNYVQFHLDKPCNQKALSIALQSFYYNGYYYYLPKEESQIKKLNVFKDSDKYRYTRAEAYSIANTNLKDLQEAAELFNDETIKKYYVICYGLLSSVKGGLTSEGIKNYIEFKLGSPCDNDLLYKVLKLFAEVKSDEYSSTPNMLYCLIGFIKGPNYSTYLNSATVLYLNKKIFGSTNMHLDEAKAYECPLQEAFQICYPEVFENIKTDYQKILAIVDEQGTNNFETGLEKIVSKYKDIIGKKNIEECIHIITKKWYFEDNKTVYKILVERMVWYLYKTMMGGFNESILECYNVIKEQAAAITLRALNFEKYDGNQENYSSITKDACIEFISNNEYFKTTFEKEIAKKPFDTNMEELVESMANSVNYYNLFSSVWYLPSIESEPYYADSICKDYWIVTISNRHLEKSTDPNYVFDRLFENLEPNERDKQLFEEAKVKKQIRAQCRTCVFYDHCKLPNPALNCSAYVPQ